MSLPKGWMLLVHKAPVIATFHLTQFSVSDDNFFIHYPNKANKDTCIIVYFNLAYIMLRKQILFFLTFLGEGVDILAQKQAQCKHKT